MCEGVCVCVCVILGSTCILGLIFNMYVLFVWTKFTGISINHFILII